MRCCSPPPDKLPPAARHAALRSPISKGLLEEMPAPRDAIGLGSREDDDGSWIALRITAAGPTAMGLPSSPQAVDDGETTS